MRFFDCLTRLPSLMTDTSKDNLEFQRFLRTEYRNSPELLYMTKESALNAIQGLNRR